MLVSFCLLFHNAVTVVILYILILLEGIGFQINLFKKNNENRDKQKPSSC